MTKKTKKTTATKKSTTKTKRPSRAKKPTLKLVGRSTAKVAKKKAAPKAPKRHTKTGNNVIWKFLEMKEARRQQAAEARQLNRSNARDERFSQGRDLSFTKFAGPRRRAA